MLQDKSDDTRSVLHTKDVLAHQQGKAELVYSPVDSMQSGSAANQKVLLMCKRASQPQGCAQHKHYHL
jgi:hypothetical protein